MQLSFFKQCRKELEAHFHPWYNEVVCLCFQTALLLNNALWLAIYCDRLAFSTGKLIAHSKLVSRPLSLIILEIGISYSWKWMNQLPMMNPSTEMNICLCCCLSNEITIFILTLSCIQKCTVHAMVRVNTELIEVHVHARRLVKTALWIPFAKKKAKSKYKLNIKI